MKLWKRIILAIYVIILNLLPATAVLAADSVDIGVRAHGIVSGGITDFTITYISETRLDLSWILGDNVSSIMIRAKYGKYPADIPNINTAPADGYLVYSGNATSVSDNTMDFDANPGPIYYRAWAQLGDGTWVISPSEGWKESNLMTLLGIFGLAAVLSFLAYKSAYYAMKLLAGVAWIGAMLYWINNPPSAVTAGSSAHVVVMFVLGICGAAFILWPFLMERKGGNEIGGSFRINVDRLLGREETPPRRLPSREDRLALYRERLKRADRGER